MGIVLLSMEMSDEDKRRPRDAKEKNRKDCCGDRAAINMSRFRDQAWPDNSKQRGKINQEGRPVSIKCFSIVTDGTQVFLHRH